MVASGWKEERTGRWVGGWVARMMHGREDERMDGWVMDGWW